MEGERKKKEEEKKIGVGGEREEIREERKRKAHIIIEVHKEDLRGGSVASCSEAFDYSLRLCGCPLGHNFLARIIQHLAFVGRCLSSQPQFQSMPIFYFQSFLRHHGHGASLHLPPHLDYALHEPVRHHQHKTNFIPPRC